MSRIPDKDTLDPRLIECIKSFPGNTIVAWKLSSKLLRQASLFPFPQPFP